MTMRKIETKAEFAEFAREIGMKSNWHEPDEQDITARVEGTSFDNAGFWPRPDFVGTQSEIIREMHVIFSRDRDDIEGNPREDLAMVNLATLCAWASFGGE